MDDPSTGSDEQWARFIETGSPDLRNALAERYLPLVRLLAERLRADLPQNVELDDLIGSGTFGLLSAIDSYDQAQGAKFETFASVRIRGAMLDELRTLDWAPRLLRVRAHRIQHAAQELEAKFHRAPTDQDIAQHIGLDAQQIRDIRRQVASPSAVSLTTDCAPGNDGEEVRRIDILQDVRTPDPFWTLHRKEIRSIVAETIESLPKHERLVVILYYFEQLTMKQIGKVLDISESRICQIHAEIILRLQRRLIRWKEELLALQR